MSGTLARTERDRRNPGAEGLASRPMGCAATCGIPILKARMSPDLRMAGKLKNTGAGNLFVVFAEARIDIREFNRSGDEVMKVFLVR